MKSGTTIKHSILGISCTLLISSCCCFGARDSNIDMRKGIVNEGTNNFSDIAAFNSYQVNTKTANDIPYVPLPTGE